eukprot:g3521.t1
MMLQSMKCIRRLIVVCKTTKWSLRARRFVTLEVPAKDLSSEFKTLSTQECFSGFITPDLPKHSKFSDLFTIKKWQHVWDISPISFRKEGAINAKTIAVQARSKKFLLQLMKHYGENVEALLCLSGDSYLRKLPFAQWCLQDSLWILEQTKILKERGDLPKALQLWAVANPNKLTALDQLQYKIDRGAEVIVTQPPLLRDNFENWLHNVMMKQLDKEVQILIGIPIITSFTMMKFWCTLAEIPESKIEQILPRQSDFSDQFWFEWNRKFITVLNLFKRTTFIVFWFLGGKVVWYWRTSCHANNKSSS